MKGLILMPLIIPVMGITVYGGYTLLASIFSLIFGVSSLGVGFNRSRFLPSNDNIKVRQQLFYPAFYFQLISIVVLSLIFVILYPILDSIFFRNEVKFLIWIAFPYLISYFLYSQATDYFRYTHRVKLFNYAIILFPYLNIGIIILAYLKLQYLTVNLLFLAELLSAFIIALPLLLMIVRDIGFRLSLNTIKTFIEDIKLGFPLVLGFIVDIILSSSDRYIIAGMISVTAVGYYTPAYALGSLIAFFPKVSGVVLPPLMSKTVDSGNENEAIIILNYTIEGFFLLAIPFIVGCSILSKPLLTLIGNVELAQNAYIVTPIVALGTLFYGLNLILSNILFVRMKTAVMFNMNIIAAIINLVLNFILLYIFKNILIAAATTFLSYFIAFIYIRRAVLADWPLSFPLKKISKAMIASLVMGICLLEININLGSHNISYKNILGEIFAGIMIYCLILFALKTFTHQEINYLKKVFS